jgi:hypothetical protein
MRPGNCPEREISAGTTCAWPPIWRGRQVTLSNVGGTCPVTRKHRPGYLPMRVWSMVALYTNCQLHECHLECVHVHESVAESIGRHCGKTGELHVDSCCLPPTLVSRHVEHAPYGLVHAGFEIPTAARCGHVRLVSSNIRRRSVEATN